MSFITKYLLTTLLIISFGVNRADAQNFDKIADAIRSGNVSAISAGFGANVEIGIKDAQNSYSKPQAEAVLKNFFGSHTPKSFNIVHKGNSPDGAQYFIGTLSTSAGPYRTYVYAKQVGGNFVIQEIKFEGQ